MTKKRKTTTKMMKTKRIHYYLSLYDFGKSLLTLVGNHFVAADCGEENDDVVVAAAAETVAAFCMILRVLD